PTKAAVAACLTARLERESRAVEMEIDAATEKLDQMHLRKSERRAGLTRPRAVRALLQPLAAQLAPGILGQLGPRRAPRHQAQHLAAELLLGPLLPREVNPQVVHLLRLQPLRLGHEGQRLRLVAADQPRQLLQGGVD